MKETAKHQRAFEAYYALGSKRSLPAVARSLRVSHASVKLWSRTFGWAARVAERDQSVAHVVEQRSVKHEVDRRGENDQIIRAAIIKCARAIADGTVKATMADLDRMVRLQRLLDGEADSRQEIIERDLRGKTTGELKTMLRSELRDLNALVAEDADFELEEGAGGD